jgi:peptidoglycan biosynthesis protein MviN/MurJ (putative lipid II flippase)
MSISNRAYTRKEEPGDPPADRIAGSVAITAGAQLVAMATGTVVAILVVAEFGKGARSDGLFAAYGVYSVLVMLAQSVRLTMVARLIEGAGLWSNLDRFVAAMLLAAGAGAVVLVGLGEPVAELLVGSLGNEATDTAQTALAILWLAAAAQLLAALFAASLGALADFTTPGLAYAAGGLASVAFLLLLEGELGIDAVATAVALGSALTFCIIGARLLQAGYRPHLGVLAPRLNAVRAIGQVVAGAVGSLLWQVAYVATLAFASRLSAGAITVYSYAFFAAMLVVSITSGALGIVLAAPLTRTWGDDARSLEPHERRVVQWGMVITVPIVATVALVGDEIAELLLGSRITAGDADDLASTFVCLVGVIIAGSAATVPGLAAFARGQYGKVAVIAGFALLLHLVLTAGLFRADRVWALAIAASLSALSAPTLLLVLVHGRRTGARIAVSLLGEVGRLALLGCLAFGPTASLAILTGGGVGAQAAAAVLGTGLFCLALRALTPTIWELIATAAQPLVPTRLRRRPGSAPPRAAR